MVCDLSAVCCRGALPPPCCRSPQQSPHGGGEGEEEGKKGGEEEGGEGRTQRTATEVQREERQAETHQFQVWRVTALGANHSAESPLIPIPFTPREKTPPAKLPRQEQPAPCWLQRDLRVRFIDKAFKGGKYYNSKVRGFREDSACRQGSCECD